MAAAKPDEMRSPRDSGALLRIAEVARICRANGNRLEATLDAVLDAAIELTGADKGDIQRLDASGALVIAAQQGFEEEFLTFFARVEEPSSACGLAVVVGEQIVEEDVETSDIFAGSDALPIMLRAGVRAVQSTPMLSVGGKIMGVLSTHYASPYRPTDGELAAVSLLAGIAADHLEHANARRTARWSAETLNTLLDILPIPAWISLDPECRDIHANTAALALYGVDEIGNVSQTAAEAGEATVIPHYRSGERVGAEDMVMQRAARTGLPQREEMLDLVMPNGDRKTISGAAAPLFDDDGKVRGAVAACADITALREAEDARELVARELLHRGNNLLTVVQGLAHLCAADATRPAEAFAKLELKLQALAQANLLLARADHRGVDLRDIATAGLEFFAANFELEGEAVWLGPAQAQNLSLALHELGTNAIKYGALSNGKGSIELTWRVERSGRTPAAVLTWNESGGPRVSPPLREGQGTRLLRSLYKGIALDYQREGLRCEIRIPLPT